MLQALPFWAMQCGRRHCFFPPGRVTTYYQNSVAKVRAEAQEVYYGVLVAGQFLTADEHDVLRWGGNAKTATPSRFQAGSRTYKHATALECLVGFLYLTNPGRLQQLMVHLGLGNTNA